MSQHHRAPRVEHAARLHPEMTPGHLVLLPWPFPLPVACGCDAHRIAIINREWTLASHCVGFGAECDWIKLCHTKNYPLLPVNDAELWGQFPVLCLEAHT